MIDLQSGKAIDKMSIMRPYATDFISIVSIHAWEWYIMNDVGVHNTISFEPRHMKFECQKSYRHNLATIVSEGGWPIGLSAYEYIP